MCATLCGFLFLTAVRPPDASGGSPVAARNGDIDGDGAIDVTDAVRLLRWLFRDGPAPASIDCPVGAACLPPSGQTECYDDAGEPVPCADTRFPGQDATSIVDCLPPGEARFQTVGGGTVIDRSTGLMWQRSVHLDRGLVWQDALLYGDEIILAADGTWTLDPTEAEAHGGVLHDDWRLPDVRELGSLIDFGRSNPAVDPAFAINPEAFWTSTTFDARRDEGWCINLFDGKTEPIFKGAGLRVLVVRDVGE